MCEHNNRLQQWQLEHNLSVTRLIQKTQELKNDLYGVVGYYNSDYNHLSDLAERFKNLYIPARR